MDAETWGIVGVIIAAAIFIVQYFWRRKDKKVLESGYYEAIWKRASQLTPDQVMHSRSEKKFGFHKYYYPRPIDDKLREMIDQGEHVVVIGKPLSGKTRSVFHALKNLNNPAVVTIPTLAVDNFPADIEIPYNKKMVTREVLMVDDIGKFLAKPNFTNLLRKFARQGTIIVGTCWETEAGFVQQKLEQEAGIRINEYLKLDRITPEEAIVVAEKASKSMPETFDGNIGSIFLDIEEMKDRYEQVNAAGKAVLESVKRLYQAGVFEGREVFSLNNIRKVADEFHEIDEKKLWWDDVFGKLTAQGFSDRKENGIHFEEAYLQYVVEGDFVGVVDFRRLVELSGDDPTALLSIVDKSYEQRFFKLEKAAYMKVAISACKLVLNIWTRTSSPELYAVTQDILGNAYGALAQVEDMASNCKTAIEVYNEALRIRTFDDFPILYATTQNNLGTAYITLAEVQDKSSNCKTAIGAFKETLRVYTLDYFPMHYAITQNNLGAAYQTLAEVEDKPSNCKAAIAACKESLRVITLEDSSLDYAMTQYNLGKIYKTLAEAEDKSSNCKLAIGAYKEALRIYTFGDVPMYYAMTQNNLGIVYGFLAKAEDQSSNYELAIEAYKESLRVRTCDDFPIEYARIMASVGFVYGLSVNADNKAENCAKAMDALEEALRVFTELKMEQYKQNVQRGIKFLASICEGEVGSES